TGDFKIYREDYSIGIAQAEVVTLEDVESETSTYLAAMQTIQRENQLDWVMFLITNVMKESSYMITTAFPEAGNISPICNACFGQRG
ncbi:MAG: hypothetical protein QGG25_06695, partial [Phycisphaerae bacterium]|nr:hypothetical protein [Phycisphaerae bacterium]